MDGEEGGGGGGGDPPAVVALAKSNVWRRLRPVLPLRAPVLYQGVHEEHRGRETNRDARCSLSPGQLA